VSQENANLKKTLSKIDLLSIGIGAVIGWSWVVYGGYWSVVPGTLGGVGTFVIAALLCSLVGLIYAEVTSAFPRIGVDVSIAYIGLGRLASIIVCWCTLILWGCFAFVESIMFPIIMGNLGFTLPTFGPMYSVLGVTVMFSDVVMAILVNTLFAFINFKGSNISGKVQTACVLLLSIAAVFFCFSGFLKGSVSNARPFFTNVSGFATVMLMVPGFMSGFNAIPQAVEDSNVKPKTIGRMVLLTVWGSALFYILIILGTGFAANESFRSSEGLIVIEALSLLYNGNGFVRGFVALASLVGMLTTWNAAYIAGSRFLYGMSRSKLLPPVFLHINKNNSTPDVAILFLWALGTVSPFFGKSPVIYGSVFNINSFTLVITWLIISISFVKLRNKMPDLKRPYKVRAGKTVGVLSTIFCAAYLFIYTPFGPSGLSAGQWLAVIGLAAIAVLVYIFWNRKGGNISDEEFRTLLLGEY